MLTINELSKSTNTNSETIRYYEKIGIIIVNDIKTTMVTGNFTPLKSSTIKAKGSTKPLIDTGELRNSISYEVRNK